MPRPRVCVLVDRSMRKRIFDDEALQQLRSFADVAYNENDKALTGDELKSILSDADGCITGWGCSRLTGEVLEGAAKLRIMAHAAGSVKPFVSDALWERGIVVTSAAAAIAIDVAETTLALTIVSLKKIWQYSQLTRQGGWGARDPCIGPAEEMHGKVIGIVGASHVGRRFISLLKNFEVQIVVYDPHLSADEAERLGVRKAGLNELMATADVVSLHAPMLEETRHMINRNNLRLMKDGAILINTARGGLIDEAALISELKTGRIFACIDVTDPEPPAEDSELRRLPNVILTPHLAGSVSSGAKRLGRLAVEELRRFFTGEPQLYPVTKEMLARIA